MFMFGFKMAEVVQFKKGDLVWARVKGFPAWPAKISEPADDVRVPADTKLKFVIFYGSDTYGFVPPEQIWPYAENKEKFMITEKIPEDFDEAIQEIEKVIRNRAARAAASKQVLASIDAELKAIFPDGQPCDEVFSDSSEEESSSDESKDDKKEEAATDANADASKLGKRHLPRRSVQKEKEEQKKARLSIVKTPAKKAKTVSDKDNTDNTAKTEASATSESTGEAVSAAKTEDSAAAGKMEEDEAVSSKEESSLSNKTEPGSKVKSSKTNGTPKMKSSKSEATPKLKSSKTEGISKPKTDKIGVTSSKKTVGKSDSVSKAKNLGNKSDVTAKKLHKSKPSTSSTMKTYFGTPTSLSQRTDARITSEISPSSSFLPDIVSHPPKKDLKIGFLGLGKMGSIIVNSLLKCGFDLTVWNRTPSKCKYFVDQGASKGSTPAEVVQLCDITISCVTDAKALKDLVSGSNGVLASIIPGKSFVDMSTVDVEMVTELNEAIIARGGRFLEAPVIGSLDSNEELGQLLVVASGDQSLFDECHACFSSVAKRTFYLSGCVGSATCMKLVINMLLGTLLAGLAESLALGEKVGLNQEQILHIMSLLPVASRLNAVKGEAMIKNEFTNRQLSLEHMQRDLRLAISLAEPVEQPTYVTSATNELFKKAKARGYGDHDTAAIYRATD